MRPPATRSPPLCRRYILRRQCSRAGLPSRLHRQFQRAVIASGVKHWPGETPVSRWRRSGVPYKVSHSTISRLRADASACGEAVTLGGEILRDVNGKMSEGGDWRLDVTDAAGDRGWLSQVFCNPALAAQKPGSLRAVPGRRRHAAVRPAGPRSKTLRRQGSYRFLRGSSAGFTYSMPPGPVYWTCRTASPSPVQA
jgi:hypothetical protein